MRHIILGSASPRRRELLGQAGIPFEVIVSDEEEVMEKAEPQRVVQGLAAAKAKAVAGRVEGDALVIGADTVVALDGETIVGFGDMDQTGYLDRLYVHQDYQGQGIASALCEQLETAVQGKAIVTHASITARPFFEKRGYHVVREQQVERQGVLLTNYVMEKAGDGRRTAPACDAAGKSLTPEKT